LRGSSEHLGEVFDNDIHKNARRIELQEVVRGNVKQDLRGFLLALSKRTKSLYNKVQKGTVQEVSYNRTQRDYSLKNTKTP
jgi:hypothetical protein